MSKFLDLGFSFNHNLLKSLIRMFGTRVALLQLYICRLNTNEVKNKEGEKNEKECKEGNETRCDAKCGR